MIKKFIVRLILLPFFFTSLGPLPKVSAQAVIDLPAVGSMVNTSTPYEPLQIKGILVNIKNPLRFDFLVDKGNSSLSGQPLKDEIIRLTKYFLTCLTVPDNDLWVNLSPYEKDRIVPGNFGVTLMGKDLLEQDYLLKQIMASLSYPENDLGKRFWQRVYRKSYELYGTTEIPISTFNKVWILPKSAQVYAQGNSAFVVNSQLDVMLEADYKAFAHHQASSQTPSAYSQIFRDVILPELRQEVNEGKNFAVVRQVYNAMILATWYKRHLENSLLGRMYVGKNEVEGVDIADKDAKEKIFQQYLKAYKKCVYNYVKEDLNPLTGQSVAHKYASGGVNFVGFGGPGSVYKETNNRPMKIGNDLAMATVDVTAINAINNDKPAAVSKYFGPLSLSVGLAVGGFDNAMLARIPSSLKKGLLVMTFLFATLGAEQLSSITHAPSPRTNFATNQPLSTTMHGPVSQADSTATIFANNQPQPVSTPAPAPDYTLKYGDQITTAVDSQNIENLKNFVTLEDVQALNGATNPQTGLHYNVDMSYIKANWNKAFKNKKVDRVIETAIVAAQHKLNLTENGSLVEDGNLGAKTITAINAKLNNGSHTITADPLASSQVGSKVSVGSQDSTVSAKAPLHKFQVTNQATASITPLASNKVLVGTPVPLLKTSKVDTSAFMIHTDTTTSAGGAPPGGPPPDQDSLKAAILALMDSTRANPNVINLSSVPAVSTDSVETNQNGTSMSLSQAIGQTVSNTDSIVKLETKVQDAQQKMADAPEKGTVRLYVEGDNENNPVFHFFDLGLEYFTPPLTHPTKAHDARQAPIDNAFAKAIKNIRIRGNVNDLFFKVKENVAINNHLKRLESTKNPGVDDGIAKAQEEKRQKLVDITSSLIIPIQDLPADSTIAITDVTDIGQIQTIVKGQGVDGQTQATVAGLTVQGKVEGVRGQWDLYKLPIRKKMIPSHLTIHISPAISTVIKGGGVGSWVSWLLGLVTPQWRVYAPFDAQAQAGAIQDASAVWQDARLNTYRQLRDILLDLHQNQIQKMAADSAWNNRGNESNPQILEKMSANILDLERKILDDQQKAVNMGVSAELVESTNLYTERELTEYAKNSVDTSFQEGVKDMKYQVGEWQKQLELDKAKYETIDAKHKGKKNYKVSKKEIKAGLMLEAVKSIAKAMETPLVDQDIPGMPTTDATGGASTPARGFNVTSIIPSITIAYTSGVSSNSSEAPTFIKGLNEGVSGTPNFHIPNKKTEALQSQMNFAQEQFVLAQHGEGVGSKEFRQAVYSYLTASLAKKVVSSGQGFDFTLMLGYLRTTDAKDDYKIFSLQSLDPINWIMQGIKMGIQKLTHKDPQMQASEITANAFIEEYKMTAKEDMFQAREDSSKGPHWQAWNNFLNGDSTFIIKTDAKGKVYNQFDPILQSLRQEFKPLWENGREPGQESLDLRIMELHLETAKKLLSFGPDKVTYFTAPVLVWIGSNGPAQFWEGLRGAFSVNVPPAIRAHIDALIQIAQLEDQINRFKAKWNDHQAEIAANTSAHKAMDNILLAQAEGGPLIVQAPPAQWRGIARAVGEGNQQPLHKELIRINKKRNKEPPTIALNLAGSLQLNPGVAGQVLGGFSFDLMDWVRHARVERNKALLKQAQYQQKVDEITAARHVMDLFYQQQFALGEFKKVDSSFKLNVAKLQAIKKGNAKGLNSQSDVDTITQVLEYSQKEYLDVRTALETASKQLILALNVLPDSVQKTFDIKQIQWNTAPIPKIIAIKNSVDTTAVASVNLAPKAKFKNRFVLLGSNLQMLASVEGPPSSDSTKKIKPLIAYRPFSETASTEISQKSKDEFPWYVGFATAGGLFVLTGIGIGGAVVKRRKSKKAEIDTAMLANKGGIDMNSRLMQLNITGDNQNRFKFDEDSMSGTVINGVVPQVSGIVTVTPEMLKTMLGKGYLN